MEIELITLPNDPNPMIRLNSSMKITVYDLKQIQKECMQRFKTASHMTKAKWHRLGCYAEAILDGKNMPYNGIPAIGPFIGKDVRIPEVGEIVTLSGGIEVRSDMPRLLGEIHHERISRQIRVSHVTAGYVNLHHKGEVVDPMVHWDLKNGYFGWTSVKNIKEVGVSYLNLEKQG